MFSTNDLALLSFVFAQSNATGFWPTTAQGWAAFIGPTAILLGAFSWLVNHFIIKPLKADVASLAKVSGEAHAALQTETRKSVRGLRRTVQSYMGRVVILDENIRDCNTNNTDNSGKVAGLEARVTQVEKNFREIELELRDIKSFLEYKVMEKLNDIADSRKREQ